MATALPSATDVSDPHARGPAHGSRGAATSARSGSADRSEGHGQRPDIQGMRAIAVLLVVASHAEIKHILAGGYIGVDVFFVVSGFLITGLLAREVRSTGRVSFAGFYAKRARRILPAASVTLLLTLLVSTLVYTDGDLSKVATDVRWAAFFAANLHFAQAGNDYFAAATFETPVQHFWSLAVEEQFYLVWPVLIALMLVLPWRRREKLISRGPRATRARIALGRTQALRRATVLIALLSLISLGWSIHDTAASPQSAYFSTFTRGWELGLGSLLALTAHHVGHLPDRVKAVMSWTGLAAVLFAAVVYTPATPFPGVAALVPVLGAVLILAGGIDGPRYGATLVLGIRPVRFIGDISYSVYLVHWPVLILANAYAGGQLRIRYKLMLIVVAIALAWLSYRWVETPFRSTKRRGRHTTVRALALWPAALAMVLAPAAVIYQSTMAQSSTTAAAAQKVAQKEAKKPSAVSSLRAEVAKASDKAQAGDALPTKLVPSLVHLEDDKTEPSDDCWAGTRDKTSHKLCPSGDTKATTTVVIYGDSHAAQWLKPLSAMAKQHHIKLIPLTKAGCMPADVHLRYKGIAYDQCDTYRTWAMQQIKQIKPKLVILSGLLDTPILDPDTGKEMPGAKGTELFKAGAARTLEELHTVTDEVDIISDQSRLPKDAGTCLGSRTANLSTCAESPDKVTVARDAAWKSTAAKHGADYIDMRPWECHDDVCPIVVDGTIVYRDDHHLTTTYAERLRPVLAEKIDFKAL
ncbi:acyltransferase [Flexivirga endophytica]|uniref:Acyltransferase n=1 Tax=Flexivirga endophytica TaxID=1849103 RepID=A0A916WNJ7_9MICO|nr:acyltransferase family protein [Flexivirga endophytica]GGB15469.1 acyltransferase [Flexivirga endophytica]GHB40100.1 acyltransferase [Flexivirga endophytica]